MVGQIGWITWWTLWCQKYKNYEPFVLCYMMITLYNLAGLATSGRSVDAKLKGDASVCCHSASLAVSATTNVSRVESIGPQKFVILTG